jgi:type IV pilus assembly protein PilW
MTMRPGSRARGRVQGFSLVELLVAITIGLFLLAGAVTMFATNRRVYEDQQDLGDLQQSARFAVETLAYDLRMAGYMGCAHDPTRVHSLLAGAVANGGVPGGLFDFTFPIEGLEAGSNWLPTGNGTDFVVVARGAAATRLDDPAGPAVDALSDAITVRSIGGPREDITSAGGPATFNNAFLRIVQGDVVALADCAGTEIFQNTAAVDPAGASVTLGHARGGIGVETANALDNLLRAYGNDPTSPASVSRVTAVRYFIGSFVPDGPLVGGEPARRGLFRRYWDPVAPGGGLIRNELLVDGVDRMEITYGVDGTGDGLPDVYVPATDPLLGAQPAGWGNVVAVRIGLLLRSLRPKAGESDRPPMIPDPICADLRNVNGTCLPYGSQGAAAALDLIDGVRRRVVTTTVFLRNDLPDARP